MGPSEDRVGLGSPGLAAQRGDHLPGARLEGDRPGEPGLERDLRGKSQQLRQNTVWKQGETGESVGDDETMVETMGKWWFIGGLMMVSWDLMMI